MDRVYDPIDTRITTNGFMLRIDKDDLEVFVRGILVDPVRVQDPQICTATSNTFLRSRLKRPLVLKLVYTLIGWLAYMYMSLVSLLKPMGRVTYHK